MDRTDGIGGSDVAAILGIDHWRTPLDVYLQKVGEAEPVAESEAMTWGKLLEDPVAQRYADVTGRKIRRVNRTLRHNEHAHMTAHIDRQVVQQTGEPRRILEVKTTAAWMREHWGDEGTDQIPEPYLCQVQHYLAVTGYDVADVAALIGGQQFRLYEVPRDDDLIRMLCDAEVEFWARVQERRPPDPTTVEDCHKRWKRDVRDSAQLTMAQCMDVRELGAVRAQMRELAAREKQLAVAVMSHLQDASAGVDEEGNVLCTWKVTTPRRVFDAKRFREEWPETAADYMTEQPGARALRLVKQPNQETQP